MVDPIRAQEDNVRVEARLAKLLDRLPCMVYRCGVGENFAMSMEYASAGSEELLGVPAPEMVARRWNTIERMTLPADLEGMRAAIRDKVVAHEPYEVMYRLRLPGDRVKWVLDRGEAIYGDDGAPLYLEGLVMDVSDQKFQELALQDENRQLRLSLERSDGLGDIVGRSESMRKVYALILKAAETDANVLIYGETGCGKDLVARAIHNYSGRKGGYVPVNCGAIPENLLESEFFGYAKGAFTGAATAKEGFVGAAHEGTLFLDEIGDLPLNLQVKFLRVLESKSYTPLGSNRQKSSSFRLVAATHRDLGAQVRDKLMRADLYYRIHVLTITIPPLRERKEDLPLLIRAWGERNGIEPELPRRVRLAMSRYDWPGNVRELHNFLDRYAAFGEGAADFLGGAETLPPPVPEGRSLAEAVRQFEHAVITQALEKCRWRRGRAAEALGLNLRTLQRKMKSLGIEGRGDD